MRVISRRKLREFWARYPKSQRVLAEWFATARATDFDDLNHLKATYGPKPVDLVDPWVVIDVGSNKYRLVVIVRFVKAIIFIRHVFTHPEYDHWNANLRDNERKQYRALVKAYEVQRASRRRRRGGERRNG